MRFVWMILIVFSISFTSCTQFKESAELSGSVLDSSFFSQYIHEFNKTNTEAIVNFIPDESALTWLGHNIPLFECPDKEIEKIYYYRWWTFRKHLKQTLDGFVFTEFITPVKHAGKYNTISCALGHHIAEGRWLRDDQYIDQYIQFWFRKNNGDPQQHIHQFSSWVPDAIYQRFLVNGDTSFVVDLLDVFIKDYERWEDERLLDSGLFWQHDVKDGMEESISGSRSDQNARPTINSYMYANALAIAEIGRLAKRQDIVHIFEERAEHIKKMVHENLWDSDANFFKVRFTDGILSDAREEIGYIPWMFDLVYDEQQYAQAWNQILDEQGFSAPWGLTTAERRHPRFRTHGTGSCEWDGAIWPFATSQTLKGLSNLLHHYKNHSMSGKHFFDALKVYAHSHQKNGYPYIGEYQDETTGEWLKGDNPRSIFYNHSTFCDLVISGLVGLQAQKNKVVISPLLPASEWDWFCLDNLKVRGHLLTIIWDESGKKYEHGKGLSVYVDKKLVARQLELSSITCDI